MNRTKLVAASLTCAAVAVMFAGSPQAYSTFSKWGSNSAVFYANPVNLDMDSTTAENALKFGLNVWSTQAASQFRYVYGGRVNDTSTAYDSRNVIIFRNASGGGALATTYSWWSGSALVDSDVVVWDGSDTFFTGTAGCTNGAYLEDVITHELGHALGLNHSSDAAATMYAGYNYCSTEMRSLAADDIAGAQALYGRTTASPSNTAPSLSISSPTSTSFLTTSSITFSAAATDSQDGNLTSQIIWTSSLLAEPIGFGGNVATSLGAGTHEVTATATDSGGLKASKTVTITVTVPPVVTQPAPTTTPSLVLAASGYMVRNNRKTDLTWSGFTATSIDIYRNGKRLTTTMNDGFWTDAVKAAGTFAYKACTAHTSTCSNEVTVTF